MHTDREWFEEDLLDRFQRYVKIHSTSEMHSDSTPSTAQQWDMAKLLAQELEDMGLSEVSLTEYCYVIARLPATPGYEHVPVIGFCAHVDTSQDVSGKDVKPMLWENYDGGSIRLPAGVNIDPARHLALGHYKGETIITSDGSTLLGADDKAGVAEIVCAIRYLIQHPEIPHGEIEIIFTPDEEIGRGIDKLDLESLRCKIAYTLDGEDEGSYNIETFNAFTILAKFRGRMIHPGQARGEMVNAVSMAGYFISMIPRNESPEATDGRYGFYCPQELNGRMDYAEFRVFIRDFETKEMRRRLDFLEQAARLTEAAFPGGLVELDAKQQYLNLREFVEKDPRIVASLRKAIRETGMEPIPLLIRGGTDGSRLSEKGIPCPNIFAGGHAFHSKEEWISLRAMVRAAKTVVNLARVWTEAEFAEP